LSLLRAARFLIFARCGFPENEATDFFQPDEQKLLNARLWRKSIHLPARWNSDFRALAARQRVRARKTLICAAPALLN